MKRSAEDWRTYIKLHSSLNYTPNWGHCASAIAQKSHETYLIRDVAVAGVDVAAFFFAKRMERSSLWMGRCVAGNDQDVPGSFFNHPLGNSPSKATQTSGEQISAVWVVQTKGKPSSEDLDLIMWPRNQNKLAHVQTCLHLPHHLFHI